MAKRDDEDEIDLLLEGILDAVPELPLTQEKMDIFLTTLKSIVPDVEIALNDTTEEEDNVSKDFYEEKVTSKNVDEIIDEEEENERIANKAPCRYCGCSSRIDANC